MTVSVTWACPRCDRSYPSRDQATDCFYQHSAALGETIAALVDVDLDEPDPWLEARSCAELSTLNVIEEVH